ncbi:unnamed protein product [Rotaria sordida]|uniref:protein-serine/threonine phosphatase n=1 Tax=Rotaria sordida TaxID=392033 RepID=A0A814UMB3_9BILA|nr:unnamed protein product [Rotaria sordida]
MFTLWGRGRHKVFLYIEYELKSDSSARKIQNTFRNYRAQQTLQKKLTWQIYEKLEYSTEQTESRLRRLFEKLTNQPESLLPSVAKILQRSRLPVDERELLQSTDPDRIAVENTYQGPRIKDLITKETFIDLIEAFRKGQLLHERYVCKILHQARNILKALPNNNAINLLQLHHVYIVGDLHGQLADLLYIFNENGLPTIDNPYLFNGDFVDRGANSVEVFLLLMVALITSPSSVFLNRDVTLWFPPEPKEAGTRLTQQEEYEYNQLQDLLWSDPDPRHHTGCRKNEYRGSGYYFGKDVTEKFLQKRRYAAIIRSHQVKEKGYELQHGGKLITIFSASNYQGHSNFGAVLQWKHNDTQPCIKSYKAQSIDMNKLSFNKRVTLLEDQAYQSIIEKIFAKKTSLQSEFAKADPTQTA